jgi:type IV secretory pathway VirB3-like protein
VRKFRVTLAFAVAAIVFTIIATITANRVLIAVLFLVLLTFIAMGDATTQRFRIRERTQAETRRTDE